MTQTTEDKAEALVNEVIDEGGFSPQLTIYRSTATFKALCRAIEQREAFEQKVSDIVHHYVYADGGPDDWEKLITLIIPAPKPDPLVDAMKEIGVIPLAGNLRSALDALGFEIREKNDG